ncbi:GIY-YIG nuclease family protein [Massilia antarctica]|uniref:GIY-YIG nuclease family protein n=1 Tax=Massilia antarctica TaxID=2765360 RepID=UPI0022720993|nr:GIY-YIG nuclease family protein [Massilia sp. H27-R4]MCY0914029.1 hypothetical protein [Massilia sp. H27-R4]
MNDSSILYRHYDAHARLLYVGVAVNPKQRLQQHAAGGAVWVSDVVRSTFDRFRTHKEVLDAEIEAIKNEAPIWNILHSGSIGSRLLKTTRMLNAASRNAGLAMPTEPCFARKCILLSFQSRGPAKHQQYAQLAGSLNENYHAVLAWMEWFGYHFDNGCVIANDGSFRAKWVDAMQCVTDDWYNEFVSRPQLGLESDFSKL